MEVIPPPPVVSGPQAPPPPVFQQPAAKSKQWSNRKIGLVVTVVILAGVAFIALVGFGLVKMISNTEEVPVPASMQPLIMTVDDIYRAKETTPGKDPELQSNLDVGAGIRYLYCNSYDENYSIFTHADVSEGSMKPDGFDFMMLSRDQNPSPGTRYQLANHFFKWGEKSNFWLTFNRRNEVSGFRFVALKRNIMVEYDVAGVRLQEPEEAEMILKPVLERVDLAINLPTFGKD